MVKRFAGGDLDKLLEEPPQEMLLTKSQAREIGKRFRELNEQARWGRAYRQKLEAGALRYSAIVQPAMPRAVMESAVKGLDLDQLRDMEKTYRQMAQKALPLAPQLAPRRQEGEPENGQFII